MPAGDAHPRQTDECHELAGGGHLCDAVPLLLRRRHFRQRQRRRRRVSRVRAEHVAGRRVRAAAGEHRRHDTGRRHDGRLLEGGQVRVDDGHGRPHAAADDELGAAAEGEDDQDDHGDERRQRGAHRRRLRRAVVALFARGRARRRRRRPRADGVRRGRVAVLRVGGVEAGHLPRLQLQLQARLSRGVLHVDDEVLPQQPVHDHDDVEARQAQPRRHVGGRPGESGRPRLPLGRPPVADLRPRLTRRRVRLAAAQSTAEHGTIASNQQSSVQL